MFQDTGRQSPDGESCKQEYRKTKENRVTQGRRGSPSEI